MTFINDAAKMNGFVTYGDRKEIFKMAKKKKKKCERTLFIYDGGMKVTTPHN